MPDYLAEKPYDTLSVASDSLGMKLPEVSFSTDMECFDRSVVDTTDLSGVLGARAEHVTSKGGDTGQGVSVDLPFATTEFVAAVALVCLYSYVLTIYSKIVVAVLRAPFSSFAEKNLLTSNDLNVSRLMSWGKVMLFLVLSLTVADLGNTTMTAVELPLLGRATFLWAYVFVFVLFLYRFVFFQGLRWYSLADDFFIRLKAKLRLTTAFLAITVVPIVLFAMFGKRVFGPSEYFLYLIVVLCGMFYVIRIALFFKAEKVSFLQYILYFCAVDLIPLSFLYALTQKF